jgi:predicted unusual protein kinase regulating ubiquinone biosynthesis (AarF/ABC1/UbiB family)
VNDTQGLRAAKINPREVGRVVDDAFAEMTFIHGFIHADPHPGNLMVRPKVRVLTELGGFWEG